MAKKPRTPTQLKRKYKTISALCFAGQFVSVATPFLIIGAVNFDNYFIQYDGMKMSIAAIMTFCVMFITILAVAKQKFKASYATIFIGMLVIGVIFQLIGQVILDVGKIILIGSSGVLGALILDKFSKKYEKKADEILEGIKEAEKEITKEAYKQELLDKEQKKVERKRR